MHTESYIDQSIPDPEGIPSDIRDILDCMAEYDRRGQWWIYDAELDNLAVAAKNAMAYGELSHKAWKAIVKKYWEHEDLVREKEEAEDDKNL